MRRRGVTLDSQSRRLREAGCQAKFAPISDQLRREINSGAGAVLIAAEALPRDETADPEVWIGPEPLWSSLPLVVLTGASDHHRLSQPCAGWNAARR